MYPRGDEAGFWDKLCPCGRESCAITHTNTLRTATRSAGQGCRERGTCPLTNTHTHTFFSHCLNPTPGQVLVFQKLQEGLQIVQLSFYRLENWGPQFIDLSHTACPVLLYQEVFSEHIPKSQPDSSVLQTYNQPHNLLLNQNQPNITKNTLGMTGHRDPPYLRSSALLFHMRKTPALYSQTSSVFFLNDPEPQKFPQLHASKPWNFTEYNFFPNKNVFSM